MIDLKRKISQLFKIVICVVTMVVSVMGQSWNERVELIVDDEAFTTSEVEKYAAVYRLIENRPIEMALVKERLAWDIMKEHYTKAIGIALTKQEIDQAIAAIVAKNKEASKEAFDNKLITYGVDPALWWRLAIQAQVFERALQSAKAKVVLDKDDIESYEKSIRNEHAEISFLDYMVNEVHDKEKMRNAIIEHASTHGKYFSADKALEIVLDEQKLQLNHFKQKPLAKLPSLFVTSLAKMDATDNISEWIHAPNGQHILVWLEKQPGALGKEQKVIMQEALQKKQNAKVAQLEVEIRDMMFVDHMVDR